MSDDFAVDPQRPEPVEGHASEAGLPEDWRTHVRELRQENARRRKENQELRAQLASASERAEQSAAAQAAADERAERETGRLAVVSRRLKRLELGRLAREALGRAAEPAEGARAVDLSRAQRLLELLPAPVDVDADLVVDDEGRVVLEEAAGERLDGFAAELVDALARSESVAAPPVGGEPPRRTGSGTGPIVNCWDADGQSSRVGKARAGLRQAAAANAAVLDDVAGL